MLKVISPGLKPDEIDARIKPDFKAYNNLKTEDFLQIKKQYNFVNFCIVNRKVKLNLPLIYENSAIAIYKLQL
jgi:hypothetical protein